MPKCAWTFITKFFSISGSANTKWIHHQDNCSFHILLPCYCFIHCRCYIRSFVWNANSSIKLLSYVSYIRITSYNVCYTKLLRSEIVFDLYCGVGTIGMYVAKGAKKVYVITSYSIHYTKLYEVDIPKVLAWASMERRYHKLCLGQGL